MSNAAIAGSNETFVCGFSALGSVTAHLIPLLILILERFHGSSTIEASIVASASMLGTFAGILLFSRVSLKLASTRLVAIVLLVQMAWLGISLLLPQAFLAYAWFAIGSCSGLVIQAGSRLIAHSAASSQLYLLRVSLSLAFAGIVSLLLASLGRVDYDLLVFAYLAVLGVFLLWAAALGKRPLAEIGPTSLQANADTGVLDLIGIGIIIVLIVGQISFLSHIAKNLVGADASVWQFALYLGLAKLLSGAGCWALFKLQFAGSDRKVLIAATVLLFTTAALTAGVQGASFVMMFFAYDIALCVFCSGIMGRVAKRGDAATKSMVMIGFAGGNAMAPIVGGWLAIYAGPEFLGIAAIASTAVAAGWLLSTANPASIGLHLLSETRKT